MTLINHAPRLNQLDWHDLAGEYQRSPVLPETRTIPGADRHAGLTATSVAWADAAIWFKRQADSLRKSGLSVSFCEVDEPYPRAENMIVDIDRGRFRVSTLHCDHPLWSESQNVNYRICHDVLGHWVARSAFTRDGEVAAFRAQAVHTPRRLWSVLFTETLGQLAPAVIDGDFGEQKCFLAPPSVAWHKATEGLFTSVLWD